MSVDDRIIWDKELKTDSAAITEAIIEYLKDNDKDKFTGFVLFMIDMRTGTVQYTSDLSRVDTVGMLSSWVKSNSQ